MLLSFVTNTSVRGEMENAVRYVAICFTLLFCNNTGAKPKNTNKVMKVAQTMCKKRVKNTILYKKFESDGVELVFVRKKIRYTVFASCAGVRFLVVWVRENGTYHGDTLKSVSDSNVDGKVDFAGAGKEFSNMRYVGPNFYNDNGVEGGEYFAYWQNFYSRAINEISAHLHKE